ncbi:MAG: NAD(P)H-hydrate dehydratase [Thermoflexales bacterium]|nr:NAD(P)H-hydrate dehydratase [Thermoflexales bacterium]MDW8292253.1 NAD(P)H-hydrate dehydratase [Anaerolineae bacterium]
MKARTESFLLPFDHNRTFPLFSVAEMRQAEAEADARGLSYAQMMQNAGRRAAEFIVEELLSGLFYPHVVVLVGPGNNGGDGLVCATALVHQAWSVVAALLRPRDATSDPVYAEALRAGVQCFVVEGDAGLERLREVLSQADVIVDALLGTGTSRPIEGTLREVLRLVASTRKQTARIVALDGVTGMNYDTGALDPSAVPADYTLSFHALKRGHVCFPAAGACGRRFVVDIGIEQPQSWLVFSAGRDWVKAWLPQRAPDANKGTHGRVLVVGGSEAFVGAPILAARAAYRVGAGLVTLAVPQSVKPTAATLCPEATFVPLPESVATHDARALPRLEEWLAQHPESVVVLGPGFSLAAEARAFLEALLAYLPKVSQRALVCDADALNWLAGQKEWQARLPAESVITPHPGEMARLMKCSVAEVQADRIGNAQRAACQWRHVVVLKGAHTVIASPDGRIAVLPFANPALAVAGTGDVLAGAIGGLMAQGLPPFEAAVCGGFVHALAAEHSGEAGLLASELADRLPEALNQVKRGDFVALP